MLNEKSLRELCYVVTVDDIKPIDGADNVEIAVVGGWRIMVRKNTFVPGDYAIYFEIDSKVPAREPFLFLEPKHYKVKTQKYFKGTVISQGLLMSLQDFCVNGEKPDWLVKLEKRIAKGEDVNHTFLTDAIGVVYADPADNDRKGADKYRSMASRNAKLFKKQPYRFLMQREWGKKFLFLFFGKKKGDNKKRFPNHMPYIVPTDQERCENMPWVLEDKTPYVKTSKCDGSSATYILERKRKGFEFYVCSRRVRQLTPDQDCFHKENYYWKAAKKYDIENKLKDYLKKHSDLKYVCWQGELCGPSIQGNPHKLKDIHLFLFHFIDSSIGKYDILKAKEIWDNYDMESVAILDPAYVMPDDFEEFKLSADGYYPPEECEGNKNCAQEGYVYYKTTDPNFSFKNVSRKYLLKHSQ